MPIDYQNGKVYRIWSSQTPDVYIGCTCSTLSARMAQHRARYKRYPTGKTRYVSSFEILKHGDAKIELIANVPCNCRDELNAKHGYYIRKLDCVNKNIQSRT